MTPGLPASPPLPAPAPPGAAPHGFRHAAGFGKRIEYWIIGRMLKEGMDVYVPLVDDNAVDALVRHPDGTVAEVQIKARSSTCKAGDGALFSAIPHDLRPGYWFVFYLERMDAMWIMWSAEFLAMSSLSKKGKSTGQRTIWLNGHKRSKSTGLKEEYVYPRFLPYVATGFSRIRQG